MLLPIGRENEVRRQPVITMALAAICVLVFLGHSLDAGHRDEAATESFLDAIEYLIEHPWLEPPEELSWHPYARRLVQQLAAEGASYGSSRFKAEEQETLNAKTRRWREQIQELPFFKWGYLRDAGKPETLITSLFIHSGWMHLLGNLLFLAIVGPPLEDVLGRVLYPLLFLVGGAFSAFFHGALTVHPEVPLGGASGAVAVLMGMFMVRFARSRLRFLLILFPFYIGRVHLRAWFFLASWALIELGYAALFEVDASMMSGVAHLAHFGGFGFGMVGMFLMGMLSVESRWIKPRLESLPTLDGDVGPGTSRSPSSTHQLSAATVPDANDLELTAATMEPRAGMQFLEGQARRHHSVEAWLATWEYCHEHQFDDRAGTIVNGLAGAAEQQLRQGPTPDLVDSLRQLFDEADTTLLAPGRRIRLAEALVGVPPHSPPPAGALGELPYGAESLAMTLLQSALNDRADLEPAEGLRLALWVQRRSPQHASRLATAFLALGPSAPNVRAELERVAGHPVG